MNLIIHLTRDMEDYKKQVAEEEAKQKVLMNGIHCVTNLCNSVNDIENTIGNALKAVESFTSESRLSMFSFGSLIFFKQPRSAGYTRTSKPSGTAWPTCTARSARTSTSCAPSPTPPSKRRAPNGPM